MSRNLDYKDVVGKLMSQENIMIVHSNELKTASFDLGTRTLYLPEFANVSEEVYDLLIGHEVSHALHTPEEGWHDANENKGVNFKSFLNVVEDARIEKIIQQKFPGLRSSFKRGYKELYDMDIFGIKNKSIQELDDFLLIDRLNLYFKLGEFNSRVSFKNKEEEYVEDMRNLQTWDDVVKLAEKLFEYCKEEMKEKEQEEQEGDPQSQTSNSEDLKRTERSFSDNDGTPIDSDMSDMSTEKNESDGSDDDQLENSNSFDSSSENPSDDSNQISDEHNQSDKGTTEPSSLTDKNFRENEQKLLDNEEKKQWYRKSSTSLDLPILDEECFFDDWKKIQEEVNSWRKNCEEKGWVY